MVRALLALLPIPILPLAACGGAEGGAGDGGSSVAAEDPPATAPESAEESGEPGESDGPRPHSDDPPGWIPIDTFRGDPVVVERDHFPDGGLRRITTYHADRVGDPQGRHGPEWSFFDNGYKKGEILYVDGVPEGPFMHAWMNGQIRYRGTFEDGERHGLYRQWFENGDLQMEFHYEEGRPSGTWREWYAGNAPRYVEQYEDGRLHGERRTWDKPKPDEEGDIPSEGFLTREENYVEGSLHGPWQDYDPFDGSPRMSGTYEHGERVGTWRITYRDGTLVDEVEYVDGQKHGLQRKFTVEGAPLEEITWDHGEKTGPARTFYPDGDLQSEGEYRQGLRQGTWIYYTPEGEVDPTWTGVYEDDQKIGELPEDER